MEGAATICGRAKGSWMSIYAEFHTPVTAHPLGTVLADYATISVEIERIVPTGTIHYVWIGGEGHEEFVAKLHDDAPVGVSAAIDELSDRNLLRIEWTTSKSPIFQLIDDTEATLIDMRGTHEGWTLRIRFPDQDAFTTFYEVCQEREIPIQLQQIYDPDNLTGDDYGITTIQRETLTKAFEAGYFDIPRRITLTELADQFAISEQAVSERLRRGLSSLLTTIMLGDQSKCSTEPDIKD